MKTSLKKIWNNNKKLAQLVGAEQWNGNFFNYSISLYWFTNINKCFVIKKEVGETMHLTSWILYSNFHGLLHAIN